MADDRVTIAVTKAAIQQLNKIIELHGSSVLPNKDLAQLVADINEGWIKLESANRKDAKDGEGAKDADRVRVSEPAPQRRGLVRAVKRGVDHFA